LANGADYRLRTHQPMEAAIASLGQIARGQLPRPWIGPDSHPIPVQA